jgi:hypothetical protein
VNASGVVTASSFVGNVTGTATGLSGTPNITVGIITATNVVIGGGTTQLVVTGNARVTGILTIGTSSITLNGATDIINVGTGITINGSTGIINATSIVVGGTTLTGAAVTRIEAGSGISVDQNTGQITITATGGGGSSQFVTTAAGIHTLSNVGIGTTNPTSALTVSGNGSFTGIVTASSFNGYQTLIGATSSATKTFIVTVASKTTNHRYYGSGSALGYFIDGSESPFITLLPGKTYRFNQEDNSNSNHPLRFYFQSDKTTQYSTNVITNGTAGSAGAYTEITITDTTPIVLHYQCSAHGYMGNAVSVNSNFIDTPHQITARNGINVTGIVTSTSFVGNLTGTASTASFATTSFGLSGSPSISVTDVNASGVVTASSFVGNLTGTATTATGLSDSPSIAVANINASGVSTFAGITTVTGTTLFAKQLNVSGVSTLGTFQVSSGIVTASSGIITYYGDTSNAVDGRWTLGANGSSDYTFTGIGFTQTTNDPVLYLARGRVYEFVNNSGGSHPFQIRVSNGGAAYSDGVTNNGSASGTIRFEVPFSAPNTLYYQCTNHSVMGNTISVYPNTI